MIGKTIFVAGWLKPGRAVLLGWLLAVLCWPGAGIADSISAPSTLRRPSQDLVDLSTQATYVTEALRGLKYSLPKYSQLNCQRKDMRVLRTAFTPQNAEAVRCAMTVMPAPQLRTLVYRQAQRNEHGPRFGEAHQYMVEISDAAPVTGPEPLEVVIEEPPQVRFGVLPSICEREQNTIICHLNNRLRNADGMFRIRLPLQIGAELPARHSPDIAIPAWLLVDNCGAGKCRPDDRRALAVTPTAMQVTSPESPPWLFWGFLLGAVLFLGVLLAHHAHSVRRFSGCWLIRARRLRC